MNTEYQEHFMWARDGHYSRAGKSDGIYSAHPIIFNTPKESWKPDITVPDGERAIFERMMKEFGGKSRIKKESDKSQFVTSYRSCFTPEFNFCPSISTYEKGAKLYAEAVDSDLENEGLDEDIRSDQEEIVPDVPEEPVEEQFPDPKELAKAALEMIKKERLQKGGTSPEGKLPVIDPKERYYRYRKFLDKPKAQKSYYL